MELQYQKNSPFLTAPTSLASTANLNSLSKFGATRTGALFKYGLSCKPNIYVSWSTSELRVRLAPLNRFKPSSKMFYWPFQGGSSFVDFLCFCSVLCLLCLCAHLFICALWSPAGKGLTSWLSFVVSTVSLSLSHWYPESGVVLDCIDSWSMHPYLL